MGPAHGAGKLRRTMDYLLECERDAARLERPGMGIFVMTNVNGGLPLDPWTASYLLGNAQIVPNDFPRVSYKRLHRGCRAGHRCKV
jgi:hypothetical protein